MKNEPHYDAQLLADLRKQCEGSLIRFKQMVVGFYRSDNLDMLIILAEMLREIESEVV